MELWLRKGLTGFEPADDDAREVFRRIPTGLTVRGSVSRPRNGSMHRKYWALCKLISDASGDFPNAASVDLAIKHLTGHTEPVAIRSTGEIIHVPKSISYAAMGQPEFDAYWRQVVEAVCEHLLPGVSLQEFENEILRMVA